MMAAIDYSETIGLAHGKTPSSNIVRTVPLPSAAKKSGPILMHPPNVNAEEILNNVGTTVSCNEAKRKALCVREGNHKMQ